jgi:hypothetical protein
MLVKRPVASRARSLAIAATLLVSTVPAGQAASPAAETVHLYFHGASGTARMLGHFWLPEPNDEVVITFAVAGVQDAPHRVVGSTHPCSEAHVPGDLVMRLKLARPGLDGAAIISDKATPILLAIGQMASVRLFTRHSGGVQLACARPTFLAEASTTATAGEGLANVAVAVSTGTIRWFGLLRLLDADTASVSVIATGLPSGSTSRVVGAESPCADAPANADIRVRRTGTANLRGVLTMIDRPMTTSGLVENQNLAGTIRLLQGSSGLQQRSCRAASDFVEEK